MRIRVAIALAAVVLLAPGRARAQSASDQAAAEALFKQARDLMNAGRYTDACPKLAESQRLDPAPGTLLNLATCYEKNGQIASAWVTYKEAATAAHEANQADRAQLARKKAAALEPQLPTLTIVVPPATDRPDLQVKRDGELVGRAEWGTPIPVDPGAHAVEASAPQHATWKGQAQIGGPSAKVSIEVPPLAEVPQATAAQATAAQPPGGTRAAPATTAGAAAAEPSSDGSTQRTIGLVVGSLGVVGLGVGSVLGLVAKSKNDGVGSHCNAGVCDTQGLATLGDARHAATGATIAFVAGGALLAGGVALFLTAPHGRPATGLVVSPGAPATLAGLTLSGGWR